MENSNGLARVSAGNAEFRKEIGRAAGLCLPCHRGMEAPTFLRAPDSGAALADWRDRVFLPHLRPALDGLRVAAQRMDLNEIVRLDTLVETTLAASCASPRSRTLGNAVLLERHAPGGEKLWSRYRTLVEAGKTPGHAIAVHAIRASAFFLTPHLAASAYVYSELAAAFPSDQELWNAVDDCMAGWKMEPPRLMAA